MMKLVFWTAFNSYRSEKWMRGLPEGSVHPVTTKAWTEKRASLWRRFTLPSILAQTRTDWRYIVLLDPELRNLTEPIFRGIMDPRIRFCYEDGPVLEELQEYEEIVLALIDGDDMYSRKAGEIMMGCPATWMYFKEGFAVDAAGGTAWKYDTIGSGPFFARRINPRMMSGFDRDKRHPTHKAVIKFKPELLPAGNFCVVLHDVNTSSRLDMRYVLRDQPADPMMIRREFGGGA